MPLVPGYKPPGKIKPNYELLSKIRHRKALEVENKRQERVNKMREEYRLNNPYYWRKSDYLSEEKAIEICDNIAIKQIRKFI